jgi:hypothetical protein
LGALYVAVDMQLRYAQQARDRVESSTVARSVLARIDSDVSSAVGLSDPARFRRSSSTSTPTDGASGAGAAAAGTAGATGGGTSSTTNAAASGSSSSSTGSGTVDGLNSPVELPLGVKGDSETLHLFVSRYPREAVNPANPEAPPIVSDLRRISFWLAGGADNPMGLARQEVAVATSDDALNNLPPGLDDEAQFVMAEEVRSLQFQYFDGTEWSDSWDSTEMGADGVTPIGSPRAVAVTIGVVPAGRPKPGDAPAPMKLHRHVIAIATANGTTQLQQQNPSTSSTQSTTGGGASP